MEIILNKRGEGLFFSLAALKAWAKKKNSKIFVYYESKNDLKEFDSPYAAIHTFYREDCLDNSGSGMNIEEILSGSKREILTKDFGEKVTFDTREDCDWFFNARFDRTNNILRTDPNMIETVKTLGVSASDQLLAHLIVINIPDNVYFSMNGETVIYSKSPIYVSNAFEKNELISERSQDEKN